MAPCSVPPPFERDCRFSLFRAVPRQSSRAESRDRAPSPVRRELYSAPPNALVLQRLPCALKTGRDPSTSVGDDEGARLLPTLRQDLMNDEPRKDNEPGCGLRRTAADSISHSRTRRRDALRVSMMRPLNRAIVVASQPDQGRVLPLSPHFFCSPDAAGVGAAAAAGLAVAGVVVSECKRLAVFSKS